jgi:phage baseplate assembly protein V
MKNPFEHLSQRIGRGLALMVGRCIITASKDAGAFRLLQADRLADETDDDMEHFGQWGLASRPLDGAEAIVVSVGGVRSHGVVIAVEDRRYRLKALEKGEVALFDDLGQVVKLGREQLSVYSPNPIRLESETSIELAAPEVKITANAATIDADDTHATGNMVVSGDGAVEGNLTVDGEADLGGTGGKFVKLFDNSNATKVKAK